MDSRCTPGYVVWACGKDPQYPLTEKVQAITALQSSLRAITECCCKIASLVAKRMLIKKSNVCPGHLIWPFLKADWAQEEQTGVWYEMLETGVI